MKLLIFSDSHGSVEPMIDATKFEKPDALVHLGDCWDDAMDLERAFPQIPLYHVPGNCDSFRTRGRREEIYPVFEGVRFLCTHGHTHNVKMTLVRLLFAAMEKEAKVALYGHTHVQMAEEQNGVLLLNPGSCRGLRGTYAVMDVQNGAFTYRLCATKDIGGMNK